MLQLYINPLALGDVACYMRCSHYSTATVTDGRYRERHVNQFAILHPANGFEMLYALSSSSTLQDLRFFIGATLWQHQCHWPTYHFSGPVAVHTLCANIPGENYPVKGFADNRVVGRLYYGRQVL